MTYMHEANIASCYSNIGYSKGITVEQWAHY